MSRKTSSDSSASELRKRAEKRAGKSPQTDDALQQVADVHRLLHELEVHQIELEMQNTELQLAHDQAESERKQYAELYDFAPIGYFTLDRSGAIAMANLTGASLAGIERSRLIGRSFVQIISPPYQAPFRSFLERVFAATEKQSIDAELLVEGAPPRPVTVEARRSANAAECRLALADITKRKTAEEALRRNIALFTSLFEQAPISVFVVDAAFRLQQVNQTAKPSFGNVAPLLGRDLREVLALLWPKRVANGIADQFRHTLETGEPFVSTDFRERRKDTGLLEVYEWQIQRFSLPNGEFGVVAFFDDVTERRKAETAQRRLDVLTASNVKLKEAIARRHATEKALRQTKREQASLLKKSDRQQRQLRDLSHRILVAQEQERKHISRELHDVVVQSLVGVSYQLALIGSDPGGNPDTLKRKIKSAEQLLQKSTDLVHSFARELRPTMLDDLGLVPTFQTYMKRFMEETGIRVSLKVSEGVERISGIERTTLYRVAQEALANVARHSEASLADVSIQNDGGRICMDIADNGQGFAADADYIARKKGRLGLLGMRERVEMIGGAFSVRSIPGESTTIHVEIPFRVARSGKS